MNFRLIFHILSVSVIFVACFMVLPIVVSIFYEQDDALPMFLAFMIALSTGVVGFFWTIKSRGEEIRHREAFIIVTLAWLLIAFFGSLPYLFTNAFDTFTDAYFESMSGFTTTGASVMTDIEKMPKGLLFWRSLSQWIGGMGIILFALAILPMIGGGGMQLFKAEVPEISVDKLRPRIVDTAKALWFIYVGFTIFATLTYFIGGMDLYDAVNHALTTMATGGFSTKNASIGHYKSDFLEYSSGFFMLFAGINYSLYFYLLRGDAGKLLKNNEFRFYISIVAIMTVLITLNLILSTNEGFFTSLRLAFFQVSSIITTTGFATADYEKWHVFSQLLLMVCMLLGGMIGSTAGGIKQVRVLMMLKQGYREIYQLIHPHAITTIKLDNKFLTKEVLGSIWGFVFLYLIMCIVATILMSACGVDMITAYSTVISSMSNVGPALGDAGPVENYSTIPMFGKWILIFCMLAGRLEVYTVIILFIPNFWKK
ncbi:MAG: TrkH family potassium uptake protein [Thermodesulfovibrionales bacterium]|nr:TrkH family potassium uptake protein [Thermodesulfovibrionales bacterium]